MKKVSYIINYGGFVGAENEYTIIVDDDATEEEIESAIQDDFEEKILDDCYWERVEDDDEYEDDEE